MYNFAINVPTFRLTTAGEYVAERLSRSPHQHRSKIFAATNWRMIARAVKRWLTTEDMHWYKQGIEMLAPRYETRLNYGRDYVEYQWDSSEIKMVKRSRYRPGVAQGVGRGVALLFYDRGTRRGWVVSSTPRPHFTPRERPGTHFTGGLVRPRAGLDGRKISSPPRFDPGLSSP